MSCFTFLYLGLIALVVCCAHYSGMLFAHLHPWLYWPVSVVVAGAALVWYTSQRSHIQWSRSNRAGQDLPLWKRDYFREFFFNLLAIIISWTSGLFVLNEIRVPRTPLMFAMGALEGAFVSFGILGGLYLAFRISVGLKKGFLHVVGCLQNKRRQ